MTLYFHSQENKEDLEKYYKKQKLKNIIYKVFDFLIIVFASIGIVDIFKKIISFL